MILPGNCCMRSFVFTIVLAFVASKTLKKSQNKSLLISRFIEDRTCTKSVFTSPLHTILTWNDFFSLEHFGATVGNISFKECIYSNCEFSHRLDLDLTLPYDQYDAILFHGIDTGSSTKTDLPAYRSPHQRYMLVLHESPIMRPDIYNMKNYFNWTISYRRDSDVYVPLVAIRRFNIQYPSDPPNRIEVWKTPIFGNMPEYIPDLISIKSKMVVWFVSNPNAQSRREAYVEELSNYVEVDIYGWGRELTCSRSDTFCNLMLDTTYKFYLAFENSLCSDYVTEKFARALNHYIVPIVYGGANYKDVAPPLSYIDVKDFGSPKNLAKYLHYLDNNPKEYAKYFWWKQYYEVQGGDIWCDICMKLNHPLQPNRVYPNVGLWWKSPDSCISAEEYFKQNFYRSIFMSYPDIEPWRPKTQLVKLHDFSR